jgi:two-component system LytT family response regulator
VTLQKLLKGEDTYLLLSNGAPMSIVRQQKERLLEHFGWL